MTIDASLAEELMDSQAAQRAAKKEYVLGFCFMRGGSEVVLIRKNKPAWQKGLLNGVGGKIEPGENAMEAMIREWREETGTNLTNWHRFVTMDFSGAVVHAFKCWLTGFIEVKSATDEAIYVFRVNDVLDGEIPRVDSQSVVAKFDGVIPNLKWLIPMALYDSNTEHPYWRGAPILKYP